MAATESIVRRPLRSRNTRWAAAAAAWLAARGVRPNQISVASVLFAALAGTAFVLAGRTASAGNAAALLVLAGGFVQLRLLCNLFDGMVAVEGGLRTKSGEVFNDLPDRIADPLILVAAGYASPAVPLGVELGWAAGLLAVLTAYVRVLAGSTGATQSFIGPMAKQHRMAVTTGGAVIAAVERLVGSTGLGVPAALAIVVVGCVVTIVRRTALLVGELESR